MIAENVTQLPVKDRSGLSIERINIGTLKTIFFENVCWVIKDHIMKFKIVFYIQCLILLIENL